MTNAFGITLYKPQEVAEHLGISKNTIGKLLRNGEIDYVSWGKKEKRITEEQVKSFIANRIVRNNKPKLYSKAI